MNIQETSSRVNVRVSSVDYHDSNLIEVPIAWAVKDLTIPLKHLNKKVHTLPHLQAIPFPQVERSKISVLLGTNVQEAFIPIEVRKGHPDQPLTIKSILGWSILGGTDNARSNVNVNCVCKHDSTLEVNLRRFWEIESHGIEKTAFKPMSVEDRDALKIIEDTLSKVDGHYQMGLLWRESAVQLPYNRPLAEARLQHLKGRLKRYEELRIKYKAVIDDYVAKGYAKKMSNEEAAERSDVTWYLPHHPVLNPNKPGKVRVVFDAAAKIQGTSLNDQLVQGPDLINEKIALPSLQI